MTQETIETLARRLAESLPQGLRNARDEMEQNFRAVLSSGLSRLDLVTREEFDVQQAVLARTREKLEALEKRLETLEMPPAAEAAKPDRPVKKAGSRKKPATVRARGKKAAPGK